MKARTLGTASVAALFALTSVTAGASASADVASERYGGMATARAVDLNILGHGVSLGVGIAGTELDPVHDDLTATAIGIGNALDDDTVVVAGPGESREGCAVPELGEVLDALDLSADVVCGVAAVAGSGTDFVATGAGRLAGVEVSTGDLLSDLLSGLLSELLDHPVLGPLAHEAFGTLHGVLETAEDAGDEAVDEAYDSEAVKLLNDELSQLLGVDDALAVLDVRDTLDDLVDRLTGLLSGATLVDVALGDATGTVDAGPDQLVTRAHHEGAVVRVLPGFWVDGSALLTVTVSDSSAEVVYERADASATGVAHNAVVVVDSPLLPQPVEVGTGISEPFFCDDGDLLSLLCTEVSVGSSSEREVNGRLQVEASLVTVHAAQGLGDLVADLLGVGDLGAGAVVPGAVLDALDALQRDLGFDVPLIGGVATTAGNGQPSGVRLEIGGALAQAGGTKVLSAPVEESVIVQEPDVPFEGALPRTGGGDILPMVAASLFAAAAGLHAFLRRRFADVS